MDKDKPKSSLNVCLGKETTWPKTFDALDDIISGKTYGNVKLSLFIALLLLVIADFRNKR